MILSSAYNDLDMVVGAGTIGLELAEDLPDVDIVLTPIGGGGLASGVAATLSVLRPDIRVKAVSTMASPTWVAWFAAAYPAPLTLSPSIAEGLAGPIDPTTVTFDLVKRYVDDVIGVSDNEIRDAMHLLHEEYDAMIEPSGAAAVAAVLSPRFDWSGLRVAAVITGRNVSTERFSAVLRSS